MSTNLQILLSIWVAVKTINMKLLFEMFHSIGRHMSNALFDHQRQGEFAFFEHPCYSFLAAVLVIATDLATVAWDR